MYNSRMFTNQSWLNGNIPLNRNRGLNGLRLRRPRRRNLLARSNRQMRRQIARLNLRTNAPGPMRMNNAMAPRNINRNLNPIYNQLILRNNNRRNNRDKMLIEKIPEGFEMQQSELFGKVTKGFNIFTFQPGAIKDGGMILNAQALIFNNYRLESCNCFFKSSVGSNTNGTVYIGVDYSGTPPMDAKGIASLDGAIQCNIYEPTNVIVNVNKAMKSKMHFCANGRNERDTQLGQAFSLIIYVETDAATDFIGTVNINYRVKFLNIDPQALDKLNTAAINQATVLANQLPVETNPSPEPARAAIDNPSTSAPEVKVINSKDNLNDPDEKGEISSFDMGHPDLGDTFSVVTTPITNADGLLAAQPKIQFRYSDGSLVEQGAIVPIGSSSVNGIKTLQFHEFSASINTEVNDILGSIYKVAKPLLKEIPIISDIIHIFDPTAYQLKLAADEDLDYNLNIDAVAYGDELTIDLPSTKPISFKDYTMSVMHVMFYEKGDYTAGYFKIPAYDVAQALYDNDLAIQTYSYKTTSGTYVPLPYNQLVDNAVNVLYITYALKEAMAGDLFACNCVATQGTTDPAGISLTTFVVAPAKDDRPDAIDNWDLINDTSAVPAFINLKNGFDTYSVTIKYDLTGIPGVQQQSRISPVFYRANRAARSNVEVATSDEPTAFTRKRKRVTHLLGPQN